MITAPRSPNRFPPAPRCLRTQELAAADENFRELLLSIQRNIRGPALVETSARHYAVVPPALAGSDMWVLWMGREHRERIPAIRATEPVVGTRTANDLLSRRLTLDWAIAGFKYSVNAATVAPSLNRAYPDGVIVVAFLSDSHLALKALRVGDELMLDLQTTGARCDANYRPVREHEPEALDRALEMSASAGLEPECDSEGRRIVQLSGYEYRLDLFAV